MKQRVISILSPSHDEQARHCWSKFQSLNELECLSSSSDDLQTILKPFDVVLGADQAYFVDQKGELVAHGLRNEFQRLKTQSRQAQKSDFARALKLHQSKDHKICDLTAGLGHDLCLIWHFGARNIHAYERHPAVYAALAWSMIFVPELANIPLELGAINQSADALADVFYFDPMYPSKKKSSALSSKGMELFKVLVGADEDSQTLAHHYLSLVKERLVIKRPVKAPFLITPVSFSYQSKTVRYDVYEPRSRKFN